MSWTFLSRLLLKSKSGWTLDLDFLSLWEVQCTETLPLKQFAVFCFPADKMNQTVAVKVSPKSQMQQSFKRLLNNLLFVSFGGNGCRRHSQVDPQQKTLWGGLLALSHCVTHIVTHHIRDCVTDDGAPRDRGETITDLRWVIWDNEMSWATSNWCEKRHTVWQPGRWEKKRNLNMWSSSSHLLLRFLCDQVLLY